MPPPNKLSTIISAEYFAELAACWQQAAATCVPIVILTHVYKALAMKFFLQSLRLFVINFIFTMGSLKKIYAYLSTKNLQ